MIKRSQNAAASHVNVMPGHTSMSTVQVSLEHSNSTHKLYVSLSQGGLRGVVIADSVLNNTQVSSLFSWSTTYNITRTYNKIQFWSKQKSNLVNLMIGY